MKNTKIHFECEIDNLYYITVEREIAKYFNMGRSDNSNIPPEMKENDSGQYKIICTERSGDFEISNTRLENGKYFLSVDLINNLHSV